LRNPHRLFFTKQAEDDFDNLPPAIRGDVAVALDAFAEDPYASYRRSVVPAEMPGYLLHEIGPMGSDKSDFIVKAFFHFGQDEKTVIIKFFGCVPYHPK